MSLRFPLLLATLLLALPLFAATRMTFEINGAPTAIAWAPEAFPLRYEIDPKVVAAHPSAREMVERAFTAWTEIPDARVQFAPVASDGSTTEKIRVSLAAGLFRDQGAAAVTTYTFDATNGRMLKASIQVDQALFDGAVNAPLALHHEVGHTLGLDHSAVISAVMYPYVSAGSGPAELDSDDVIAIRAAYSQIEPPMLGATLTGRVVGDSGGIYGGQVVAVNELGHAVGTVLTNSAGEFTLTGIPRGRYRLYVEPLDGPVSPDALQGSWRQAKSFSFPTEFFNSPLEVESGKVYGNLVLTTTGLIALNPRWVGSAAVSSHEISLSSAPISVKPGDTFTLAVGGDGFTSGMTQFEVLNPSFRRTSDFSWAANYVRATYTLEGDALPGSAVILVQSGTEAAALTGALRVHRPAAARSRVVRR
ncbi:MAG TPA: matrixin family metalloprotease [Thermoanaerobaculia bacterium]